MNKLINHERIKKRLRQLSKYGRKYASYFDWFKSEKYIKELGITRLCLTELQKYGFPNYDRLYAPLKDPPDVVAVLRGGSRIGIEVTELVDEDVVRKNEKGIEFYKLWSENEIIEKVQEIIFKKSKKQLNGGPFANTILIIHTDEPCLSFSEYKDTIIQHRFNISNLYHDIYLFFSYSPKLMVYPLIKLKTI